MTSESFGSGSEKRMRAGLRVVGAEDRSTLRPSVPTPAEFGEPKGPWRVHVRLDLLDPAIVVHRGLKRSLMSRLRGLNPVAYDSDDSIVLSFVLPDGEKAGHEFAWAKINEVARLLPPTEVQDFDVYKAQFDESPNKSRIVTPE